MNPWNMLKNKLKLALKEFVQMVQKMSQIKTIYDVSVPIYIY